MNLFLASQGRGRPAFSLTNANIVCDGNSLTQGSNGSGTPYPQQLATALSSYGATVVNKGVGGQTTNQMQADAVTDIDSLLSQTRPNLLIAWEVTNDIYFAGNPAAAVANMQTYCQSRRTAGWTVMLLGCPDRWQVPATGITQEQYRAQLQQANSLMRTSWFGMGASWFVDLEADVRFQDAANLTYYVSDRVHLTGAGNDAVVELIVAALAA